MPGTPAPAAPGAASVGAAGCLLQGGESRVRSTRTAVAPGDGGGRRSQPVLARPKGHTARRPPAAHPSLLHFARRHRLLSLYVPGHIRQLLTREMPPATTAQEPRPEGHGPAWAWPSR